MRKDREDYRDRGIERQRKQSKRNQSKKSLRDIKDMINESNNQIPEEFNDYLEDEDYQ
jgi:hypothetical protein